MILSQKRSMRPETYGNRVDQPFRPNAFATGVLARSERPEYADAYRRHMAALKQGAAGNA
jgi:hypothetical protein